MKLEGVKKAANGKPVSTSGESDFVGASLLAMDVNDDAYYLIKRVALRCIASSLLQMHLDPWRNDGR
jgi:hypothetical protein